MENIEYYDEEESKEQIEYYKKAGFEKKYRNWLEHKMKLMDESMNQILYLFTEYINTVNLEENKRNHLLKILMYDLGFNVLGNAIQLETRDNWEEVLNNNFDRMKIISKKMKDKNNKHE